jgi:hypothetical protein
VYTTAVLVWMTTSSTAYTAVTIARRRNMTYLRAHAHAASTRASERASEARAHAASEGARRERAQACVRSQALRAAGVVAGLLRPD